MGLLDEFPQILSITFQGRYMSLIHAQALPGKVTPPYGSHFARTAGRSGASQTVKSMGQHPAGQSSFTGAKT